MSGQHTPGPWWTHAAIVDSHTGARSETPSWSVLGPKDSRLLVTVGYEHIDHNVEADARLISAAPELLHVCRLMLELHDTGSWGAPPGEYLPALRAAIAKATDEVVT